MVVAKMMCEVSSLQIGCQPAQRPSARRLAMRGPVTGIRSEKPAHRMPVVCMKGHIQYPSQHVGAGLTSCLKKRNERRSSIVTKASKLQLPPKFDLDLAVTLAGFAFEAYGMPTGAEDFKDSDAHGTEVTYFDPKFVKDNYTGIMQVTLKSASNLPGRDMWGTSDPYAIVGIGESSGKSKTVYRNNNPEWKGDAASQIQLYVQNPSKQRLSVQLFNENLMLGDNRLGNTLLGLEPLCDGKTHELELNLIGDGGGGVVKLEVTFTSFPDVPDDVSNVKLEPQAVAAWRVLAEARGVKNTGEHLWPDAYLPTVFVENVKTDSQVWIWRNPSIKTAVVAFRGTEQVKWKDLITDVKLAPAGFNEERAPSMGLLNLLPNMDEPQVHLGFLEAYDSFHVRILKLLDVVTEAGKGKEPWTLYITGHSLGGALATLCAYEMAIRDKANKPKLVMYNYGSPRVGNAPFQRAFDMVMSDRAFRLTNIGDIVPTVPRMLGYKHIGQVVNLSAERGIIADFDELNEELRDEKVIADVLPDLLDEKKRQKILEDEKKVLQSLLAGKAIDEHMEDFYFKSLQICLEDV